MHETVESLPVISQNGERLLIKRVTAYEVRRLTDGGEIPASARAYLPDGTEVEELMNGEFVDRGTDTFYKPV